MKNAILACILSISYIFASEIIVPLDFEEDHSCFSPDQRTRSIKHGVTIDLSFEYPSFTTKNSLTKQIRRIIQNHISTLERNFVNEIVDRYDHGEFDEYYDGPSRNLDYRLIPTYYSEDLISLYGCCFRYYAHPHGCIRYEGRTFWEKDHAIRELALDELFIQDSGYTSFIIGYCEAVLKATGAGYYTPDYPIVPVITPFDIRTFILTKKGMTIIFQPFIVGTWTEGPDYVVIPYEDLKPFIRPQGPLERFKSPTTLKQSFQTGLRQIQDEEKHSYFSNGP